MTVGVEKRTRQLQILCQCNAVRAPTEPQSVSSKHPVFESFWTQVDEDHDFNTEDNDRLDDNYIDDVEDEEG